jgi:hypothetical protein
MTERGFWRHTESGRVWAVEIEKGQPVKCCGPLDASDADEALLPYLDYSTKDLPLIRAEWSSYSPLK